MNFSGGIRDWYRKTLPVTGFIALAYILSLAGFLLLMVLSQSGAVPLPPRLSPYILRLASCTGPL